MRAGIDVVPGAKVVALVAAALAFAACDDPAAPAPLVAVEAEFVDGEPGAVAITALNTVEGAVWFTCTQPRFVIERRVSGNWVEFQSAGGILCDEAGPFALSPGQDLLQFAQLADAGTYRFAVFVQDEPDAEAAGEIVYSNSISYVPAD